MFQGVGSRVLGICPPHSLLKFSASPPDRGTWFPRMTQPTQPLNPMALYACTLCGCVVAHCVCTFGALGCCRAAHSVCTFGLLGHCRAILRPCQQAILPCCVQAHAFNAKPGEDLRQSWTRKRVDSAGACEGSARREAWLKRQPTEQYPPDECMKTDRPRRAGAHAKSSPPGAPMRHSAPRRNPESRAIKWPFDRSGQWD